MWGRNDGEGTGVRGQANSIVGAGVRGINPNGDGVYGSTAGVGMAGVRGSSTAVGDGVAGWCNAAGGVGVRGTSASAEGFGVLGESGGALGVGVLGSAASGGTGVAATAAAAATALAVNGLNRFTQAGRGAFEAGARQAVIPNLLLTATSGILVTLNSITGPGVFLQYARVNPNTKRAVLRLNKPPKRAVKFTYFIVDEVVP
jgi:hypothetical protein